jgi:dTDP-4-amino-4,6-dideoxygalactose transaminase
MQKIDFLTLSLNKYKRKCLDEFGKIFNSQLFVDAVNVKKLETKLSKKFNREVVAMSNGTSGLITVLDSIISDNKNEVIVPSLTFSATIQAIIHAGGKPIFVDINENDWCLNPKLVEKKINKKTALILPVNIFGVVSDILSFNRLEQKYTIPIVYDSCQALGAKTPYGQVGTFGAAEIFSLDASKIVSGGTGGFVSIRDKTLADKVRMAKNFGNDKQKITTRRGINGRLSEFSAILALLSLKDLELNLKKIRGRVNLYKKHFKKINYIKYQNEGKNFGSLKYFSIFLDHPDDLIANKIKKELEDNNIGTRIYNPNNLHKLSFFSKKNKTLPVTEKLCNKILCLPTHDGLKENHIRFISKILLKYNI